MRGADLVDLLRRCLALTDDGRVVSRDGETTVVQRDAGNYEIRIGERCWIVAAADLLPLLAGRRVTLDHGSQAGVVGENAQINGDIRFDQQHQQVGNQVNIGTYNAGSPAVTSISPDGRHDFYRHIHLPVHYIARLEVLNALCAKLLSGTESVVLTSATQVALHGMGGIGKTVFARALCDDPEVQAHFPDGILWTTLGRDAQEADLRSRLREWVEALGGAIPETAPTLAQLKSRLGDLLRDRACLLVVNDAWKYMGMEHFQAGGERCCLLCRQI